MMEIVWWAFLAVGTAAVVVIGACWIILRDDRFDSKPSKDEINVLKI